MVNNRRKRFMLKRIDKVLSSLDAVEQQLDHLMMACQTDRLFPHGPIEEVETELPIDRDMEEYEFAKAA